MAKDLIDTDEKLDAFLREELTRDWQPELIDSIVQTIRVAFTEAGYIHRPELPHTSTGEPMIGFLTGREWYDRLAKHLDTYDWSRDEKDSILQAAFEVAEGLDVHP